MTTPPRGDGIASRRELLDARALLSSVTGRWQRQRLHSAVLHEALALLQLVDSVVLQEVREIHDAQVEQLQQQCAELSRAIEHVRGLGHGDSLTAASARLVDAIRGELAQ